VRPQKLKAIFWHTVNATREDTMNSEKFLRAFRIQSIRETILESRTKFFRHFGFLCCCFFSFCCLMCLRCRRTCHSRRRQNSNSLDNSLLFDSASLSETANKRTETLNSSCIKTIFLTTEKLNYI